MGSITKFGDIEVQNKNFTSINDINTIKNIDINKMVVSNKVSFGKKKIKYFIVYKDAKK